jgi:hypothetical protein
METRATTEVKIYLLNLNPMQERLEAGHVVAISPSREALVDFYDSERVPGYDEDGYNVYAMQPCIWRKAFKKAGPLEWYNPMEWYDKINHWGHGIHEQWLPIDKVREFGGIVVDPYAELNTIK